MMRSTIRGRKGWNPVMATEVRLAYPQLRTLQFATGATDTLDLPNQLPLNALLFQISGTVTVGTATATVSKNLFNILDNIQLKLLNEDRISLSGVQLRRLQSFRKCYGATVSNGEISHAVGATLAAGTHQIHAQVYVPFDAGGYDSLFAAMMHNPAKLTVKFGSIEDAITKGSGGTVSFSGALKVIPEFFEGYPAGPGGAEVGGPNGFKYLDRFFVADGLNLKNSREVIFDIPTDRIYDQALLECVDENGSAVTDLFGTIKFQSLRGTPWEFDEKEMRVLAGEHSEQPYTENGAYVLPFLLNENGDTMLSTLGNQGVRLVLTLARNPADGEQINFLSSYLIGGKQGIGRFRKIQGD